MRLSIKNKTIKTSYLSRYKGSKILFFILLLLLAVSCDSIGETPTTVDRVVFAYLAGDNNLSDEVDQKFDALKTGFERAKASSRLLVFRDDNNSEPALIEIYPASDGKPLTREVRRYEGYDSADGETLSQVVADVQSMYPEASFGLILFSHASGWLPQGMFVNPFQLPVKNNSMSRSVIFDGENEMEISELATALPKGMFDYIVFETCFMAGIEVAYELRHTTPLILSSSAEIVSPGFTDIYPEALHLLFDGKLEAFAQAAFDATDSKRGWQRSATYSVIRTAELEPLREFLITNTLLDKSVDMFDVQHFDRNSYRLFFDLEDYYNRLLETDAQRAELTRLINKCVPWKAATPRFMEGYGGFDIVRHSGLTTYIVQSEFEYLNSVYVGLGWNKGWIPAKK